MSSDKNQSNIQSNSNNDFKSSITLTGHLMHVGEINFEEEETMVVRLSLDKQYWAVGLSRGAIKFYSVSLEKTNAAYVLAAPDERMPCTDLHFVPYQDYFPKEKKHLLIASYASGKVRIWHYTGATVKSRLICEFTEEKLNSARNRRTVELNQVLCCSCSLDGSRFVTGGEDAVIRVYDLQKKTELFTCSSSNSANKMDGHVMRICSILYHPWGDRFNDYAHIFVSGSWDDTVQIWDDRYQYSLWCYHGPHICGTDALDIDKERNQIITTSWKRDNLILQIWKFNDEVVHEYKERSETSASSSTAMNQQNSGDYSQPITDLEQDIVNMASMGYVAQWCGPYIIYAGSNVNIMKLIDRSSFNTVGFAMDFPKGVFSVSYFTPDNINDKRPYRFAVCAGNKVYVFRMDHK